MTGGSGSSSTASNRSSRSLTTSYADLMKPDEDWRNLPDAAERRKIQNRLAQRAYRRNMRDRTKEVEKLKKQLQDLQGTLGQNQNITPPSDHDSPPRSNPGSGHNTPPMSTASPYVATWSQPSVHEQFGGLSLSGTDANFDPSLLGSDGIADMVTLPISAVGPQPQALATTSVLQDTIDSSCHLRSNSSGPVMGPSCIVPNQWPVSTPERRESVPIGSLPSTSSPMAAMAFQETIGLRCPPEDIPFLQARSSISLDGGLGLASYPPPSEVGSQASWQSVSSATMPAPEFATDLGVAELPTMPPNVPESSAPLVHFAIASGNLDTLHVVLQQHDVDVQARDQVGYTPLQRAVASGRTDMVQTLLEHGARVDGDPAL